MGKRKQRDAGYEGADSGSTSACASQGSQPGSQRVRGLGLSKPVGSSTKPLVAISNLDKLKQLQRKDGATSSFIHADAASKLLHQNDHQHDGKEEPRPELELESQGEEDPKQAAGKPACEPVTKHWPGFSSGLQVIAQQLHGVQQQQPHLQGANQAGQLQYGHQQQHHSSNTSKAAAATEARHSWHGANVQASSLPAVALASRDSLASVQAYSISTAPQYAPATAPPGVDDLRLQSHGLMVSAAAAAGEPSHSRPGHVNHVSTFAHGKVPCQGAAQQQAVVLQPCPVLPSCANSNMVPTGQLPLQPTLAACDSSMPTSHPGPAAAAGLRLSGRPTCAPPPAPRHRQGGASAGAQHSYPPCGATGPPAVTSHLQHQHLAHVMHTTAWHERDQAQKQAYQPCIQQHEIAKHQQAPVGYSEQSKLQQQKAQQQGAHGLPAAETQVLLPCMNGSTIAAGATCAASHMQPTLPWQPGSQQAVVHLPPVQQQQQPWHSKPPQMQVPCYPDMQQQQQQEFRQQPPACIRSHNNGSGHAAGHAAYHTASGALVPEPCIPHCYYQMGAWVPYEKYLKSGAKPAAALCAQQQQQQQQEQTVSAPSAYMPAHTSQEAMQHGAMTDLPHPEPNTMPQPQATDYNTAYKQPLRTQLSAWVQHQGVLDAYAAKGVTSLYPWQAAAMECGEDGRNLVYCAPTSGGKSMVAELLLVRQLLKYGSTRKAFGKRLGPPARALLVLPYISIVSEKTSHMSQVLAGLGGTVRGYMGDTMSTPLADKDELLAVVTMEKANVALNKLIAQRRLDELVAVAIDEAHMVSDPSRGLSLELLLTKLMHARACLPEVGSRLQIVAMSATMSGLEQMRAWLDARLFMTNYRPVPLTEYVVFKHKVFRKRSPLELLEYRQQQQKAQDDMWQQAEQLAQGKDEGDTAPIMATKLWAPSAGDVLSEERVLSAASGVSKCDGLVPLVAEVVQHGHSVLVFCAGRDSCQSVAKIIADGLPGLLPNPWEEHVIAKRAQVVADLRQCSGDVANPPLEALIAAGVAYHHAGMTDQERSAVEQAYKEGAILVITATSTLAAGVNLPARRVILRTLQQGIGPVSRAQYLQMIGRAGRAGQCAIGEAFLLGTGNPCDARGQWTPICQLLMAPLPPLRSRLLDRPEGNLMMLVKTAKSKAKRTAGVVAICSGTRSVGLAVNASGKDASSNGSVAAAGMPGGGTSCEAGTTAATAPENGAEVAGNSAPAMSEVKGQSMASKVSGGGGGSGSGGKGSGGKEKTWHVPDETHLQHVLMDAIGNSSVSCPHSILQLLKSTLIYQQAPSGVLEQAMLTALTNLQDVGLINVLPADKVEVDMHPSLVTQLISHQPHGGQHLNNKRSEVTSCKVQAYLPRRACVTALGRAVFGSSLPLHLAMDLYKRLLAAQTQGMVMASGPLHPICIVLTTEQEEFSIGNWLQWARLLRSCSDLERKVARLMGVDWESAESQHSRVNKLAHVDKAHARFSAGLCLTQLVCEGDLAELEQQWGKEGGLLARGLTRGTLQRLQKQLKASAGMASQMCACAGWWQLETLMSQLSEQADAGARPELFKLMQVPALRDAPGRARELFERGIRDPAALATAPESLVQQAMTAALARSMRQPAAPLLGTKGTAAAFSNPNAGNHAMVNRIATSLIQDAQHHVLADALKVLNMAAAGPDTEPAISAAAAAVAAAAAASPLSTGAGPQRVSGGSSGAQSAEGTSLGASQEQQGVAESRAVACTEMPTVAAVQHALQQVKKLQHGAQQLRIRGNAHVRRLDMTADAKQLQEVEAFVATAPRLSFHIVWETGGLAASVQQGAVGSSASGIQPGQQQVGLAKGQPQQMPAQPGCQQSNQGSIHILSAEKVTGLIVAWNDTEAVWLDCNSTAAEHKATTGTGCKPAASLTAHPLWPCISAALMSPDVIVCCFDALQQLAGLAAHWVDIWGMCCKSAGRAASSSQAAAMPSADAAASQSVLALSAAGARHTSGCFLDPQLMLWLFQQPQGMALQAISTKEVQQAVLPGYKLRPRITDSRVLPNGVMDAVRVCLMAYSSSRALEAIGQMQHLLDSYHLVEVPLLAARAMAAAAQLGSCRGSHSSAAGGASAAGKTAAADRQIAADSQGAAEGTRPLMPIQSVSQQGCTSQPALADSCTGKCDGPAAGAAAEQPCVALAHASSKWAHTSNMVAARIDEVMWGLTQLLPEVQQPPALGWEHASTHEWACQRLQLLPTPSPAHERPPINQPSLPASIGSEAPGCDPHAGLHSYHVACSMGAYNRTVAGTRQPAQLAAPEVGFSANQAALRHMASHMPGHVLQQHCSVQSKVSWLLTELQQLQQWWRQQHAAMPHLPTSHDPAQSPPLTKKHSTSLCGPYGLLSSALERCQMDEPTTTSFTDFVLMKDEMQSLQQKLGHLVVEYVQRSAGGHASQRDAVKSASQVQGSSQSNGLHGQNSQGGGGQRNLAHAAFAAQRQLCETWEGKLVLFDTSHATHAPVALLHAAGLLPKPQQLSSTTTTTMTQEGTQPSQPPRVLSQGLGGAQSGGPERLSSQPVLCASRLIAVVLGSPHIGPEPAAKVSQQSPSQMVFGSHAAAAGTAIALVHLPPGTSVASMPCATAHVGDPVGAGAAATGVVAVQCSHVWLHDEASGPGLVADSLQHDYFHALCRVQVYLGCPMSWLTTSHLGYGMLHASLPYLPLTLLSHFCGDVTLSALLTTHSPYQAVACAWEASFKSNTSDVQNATTDVSGQDQPASQPPGIAAGGLGTLTTGHAQQAQTVTPQPLARLLQSVGGLCWQQGTAWSVQQLLTSLVLGERPAQVAVRLAGQAGLSAAARMHAPPVNKRAAKELMASFMAAFPSLQALQEKLLNQALSTGGVVSSIAGRRVRVQEVADSCSTHNHTRRPLTSSICANLQRALLRELIAASVADVQRTAVSLAVQASIPMPVGTGHAGRLYVCQTGHGLTVPAVQVGPVLPDGQLVLLLPKEGILARGVGTHSVRDSGAGQPQLARSEVVPSGRPLMESNSQCVSQCISTSQQQQQQQLGSQQYKLQACERVTSRPPDGQVLAAVYHALSRGVVQQLHIQGCDRLQVDLAWGNSCDAHECILLPLPM